MTREWTRRQTLGAGASAVAVGLAGCVTGTDGDWDLESPLAVGAVEQYRDAGCTCCERYAAYLSDNVEGTVATTVPDDMAALKEDLGVPGEYWSCHTTVVEGYAVEGHVPASVIGDLLAEAPAVDGIALPEMPVGSPGMGGEQREPFTVLLFGGGRTGEVFAEV